MTTTSDARRLDLDWVRIIAFALLILYHTGMYYVTWDFHIKSPHASAALEPWMFLTNPWRLALLFLVSGAATSFLITKSSLGNFARGRSRRLLWPLLFGMLVIVPPQSYFEVVEKLQYGGNYWEFWARYLSADHSFCKDQHCLRLPTWNHLWFVAYLWVYTMALALFCWLAPKVLEKLRTAGAAALSGWRVIVLPWLYLALMRLALLSWFPQTHALSDDWYNHSVYFAVFMAGFLFVRHAPFWEDLLRFRWLTLLLATLSYGAIQLYFSAYAGDAVPPDALRFFMRTVYALNQWCAILAVLGWARRWNPGDSPARRYLTEAIFPLYILHQTVIILLARALRDYDLTPATEGPVLVLLTAIFCFAGFGIIRRVSSLRPLFGLRTTPIDSPPQLAAESQSAA